MTTTVYIDESVREAADGFVYVLAAVRRTSQGAPLADLQRALLPGQRYVHWRDESDSRRQELLHVINKMAFDVTVAFVEGVPNRQQEYARRSAMLALAGELGRADVTSWEIERRRGPLDERDRYTINEAVRTGVLPSPPTLHFVRKTSSPALWVADVAATTGSEYFARTGRSDHWWRSLRFARLVMLNVDP